MSSTSHWSTERQHADLQRAVGGSLNLVRELARISFEFDDSIPAEWMIKRTLFLAYELEMYIHSAGVKSGQSPLPESERLALLNRFFFQEKKFRCNLRNTDTNASKDPSEDYRLSAVLIHRAGGAKVLALIYSFLADRCGIQLEFVDLKPTCFLKWTDQGRSRFIDITREGGTLSSDELIEMLHTRFQMNNLNNASLFETFTFENFIADYLVDLKVSLDPAIDPEKLLFLQNTLVAYQPSNIFLLGERAVLHRRLGNFKSAMNDLKRYFAFHERDRAPIELVRLFEELNKLLERTRPLN